MSQFVVAPAMSTRVSWGTRYQSPWCGKQRYRSLPAVPLADRQASFELDRERLGPVLVIGQEVSAHPVVVQLYAIEAVVS